MKLFNSYNTFRQSLSIEIRSLSFQTMPYHVARQIVDIGEMHVQDFVAWY